MENYSKGKNIEGELERDDIQIQDLPKNFLWMKVRGGSRLSNLLPYAMQEMQHVGNVVWTGFGQSVGKAITCAEIMKREHKNKLYQITKICYKSVEEHWDPITDGLDTLIVKRKLPMIHILLSRTPLDSNATGYQEPNSKWKIARYQN